MGLVGGVHVGPGGEPGGETASFNGVRETELPSLQAQRIANIQHHLSPAASSVSLEGALSFS
jgi:hypothetical protein